MLKILFVLLCLFIGLTLLDHICDLFADFLDWLMDKDKKK